MYFNRTHQKFLSEGVLEHIRLLAEIKPLKMQMCYRKLLFRRQKRAQRLKTLQLLQFYSQHIQNDKVVFPEGKEHEILGYRAGDLLQLN